MFGFLAYLAARKTMQEMLRLEEDYLKHAYPSHKKAFEEATSHLPLLNLDFYDETDEQTHLREETLPVVYVEVSRYNWGDTSIDILVAGEPRYYGMYQILNPSLYKLPIHLRYLAHQGNDWAIMKCAERVIAEVRPEYYDAPKVLVEAKMTRGL